MNEGGPGQRPGIGRRRGPLVYSTWYRDLGGGELRLLDHLRATAFDLGETTVLMNRDGRLAEEIAHLGIATRLIRWQGGPGYAARQWQWYSAWARAWSVMRTLRPRLVVCNTFMDLETTGRVAARQGRRLIWRARADTFPHADAWAPGRLARLVAFLNRRVDRILATTAYEVRMMLAKGVDPHRVFVVPNGVSIERFGDERAGQALRARLTLGRDDFVVAFVARMVPQKGYETFFRALALLARQGIPVRALVAGDATLLEEDPNGYRRSLFELVHSLGLADRVTFLGFRDDVHAVMNAADVFVLASLREPFGTTVIEAMAAARPVVASDLPGPRESIVEGETGIFFPPGNAEALAQRLAELHGAPSRRVALGSAGRARAAARFDLTRRIAELDSHCVAVATGCPDMPLGGALAGAC